jgi:hypothetical protein
MAGSKQKKKSKQLEREKSGESGVLENGAAMPVGIRIGSDFIPLCLAHFLAQKMASGVEVALARSLLASHSLDFAEKWRVAATELSHFQMAELGRVFEEEVEKFDLLAREHPFDILALAAKTLAIAFTLCRYFGLQLTADIESALCRRSVAKVFRHGGKELLHGMAEEDWRKHGPLFARVWRWAMPADHFCWQWAGDEGAGVPTEV